MGVIRGLLALVDGDCLSKGIGAPIVSAHDRDFDGHGSGSEPINIEGAAVNEVRIVVREISTDGTFIGEGLSVIAKLNLTLLGE